MSLRSMRDLPGPGIEALSPALAGGFLTTGPLGKSFLTIFLMSVQSPVIPSFSFLILVVFLCRFKSFILEPYQLYWSFQRTSSWVEWFKKKKIDFLISVSLISPLYYFLSFACFAFILLFLVIILTLLCYEHSYIHFCFSSGQLLSRVWLFAIPWTVACQASLSITNSQSLLRLLSI